MWLCSNYQDSITLGLVGWLVMFQLKIVRQGSGCRIWWINEMRLKLLFPFSSSNPSLIFFTFTFRARNFDDPKTRIWFHFKVTWMKGFGAGLIYLIYTTVFPSSWLVDLLLTRLWCWTSCWLNRSDMSAGFGNWGWSEGNKEPILRSLHSLNRI
jgi:hypothetical protein